MSATLGQQIRLAAFKQLEKAGQDGIAFGDISRELEVRPNTLSNHQSIFVNRALQLREEATAQLFIVSH
ncbi:hypothetical protein [Sphingobium yanoikuyae]|jgi:hypothetical protein|uniref:hypothetical protein n=1 Tax=Sphingobium yanoikuyae TaxID=13690 RepID=UPI00117B30EB|nr:hypothetical protein [Sphingobium yanoikuyae]MDH2149177.1 hypothetical protein [Sphingobium yanoikuyae]